MNHSVSNGLRLFTSATLFFLSATALLASRPAPPPPAAPTPTQTMAVSNGQDCFGNTNFNVGRGIYDVTGPAAEMGMMGYAVLGQKTTGIHTRQWARAFVIESPCNAKRLVFVSSDTGMVFQAVKQKVLQKLRGSYGDLYDDDNVILSATHTHSGPGGFSHYALYNFTILGHDLQTFNAVVDGIYNAIVRAHNDVQPGRIKINAGDLIDASFNRSANAYARNPAAERARYAYDTDKQMTLLRFESTSGGQLGMLNWFAVHPTNVGNTNTLISTDNKGVASYWFERDKSASYGAGSFVAAFAQANEGDVSPNLWGHPDTTHDYERMGIIATRQYNKAKTLYNGAVQELAGPVDFRHTFVNLSNVAVGTEFSGGGSANTCKAAIGMSFAAGSTEDGVGMSFISEGIVYGLNWPSFTLVPDLQACHQEKTILLPTGTMSPYPWTPEVLPLQVATVGQLAIAAVPFECTTMCGRRIRDTLGPLLASKGVNTIVIAGLSNSYAGYVATREEYQAQHYEGASTHFGPWTLGAIQQTFKRLGQSLRDDTSTSAGPTPRDLTGSQTSLITGVVFDDIPLFKNFGDVITNANASYSRGQTARAIFYGGHPKNNLKTMGTFLEIQKQSGSSWVTVYRDRDPETRYRWARDGIAYSRVTIEWDIPTTAATGNYRIVHYGNWKSGWTGAISGYTGTSRTFSVN